MAQQLPLYMHLLALHNSLASVPLLSPSPHLIYLCTVILFPGASTIVTPLQSACIFTSHFTSPSFHPEVYLFLPAKD